jgi:A/G-specific adenine glycosylase
VRPETPLTLPNRLPTGFAPALLAWYDAHRRPLPWRQDRDPYRIWLAEVLLQQTRVAQAVPYFERLVARFPSLPDLARASESEVLRVWAGAGYYARARHLHRTARLLAGTPGATLPREPAELERLPGIGPYIARAIASLAYDAPVVALEANGVRVAARWTGERRDVRRPEVRAALDAALGRLLPRERPGAFNEGLMELGETVCTPVAPRCEECPVAFGCTAYRELDDPSTIPLRRRAPPRPHVEAAVVVLEHEGRWLVQRRPSHGLLGGLWEFPGGKIEPGERPVQAASREFEEETGLPAPPLVDRGVVDHAYSHFTVTLHVFAGALSGARPALSGARRWVTPGGLSRLPLPKATEKVAALVRAGAARPHPDSRPGRTSPVPRSAGAPREGLPPRRGPSVPRVRPRLRR